MKISVGLFFGGKSVEHEVSVISALQAYYAMEGDEACQALYDILPIYIAKDNQMYIGEGIGDITAYRDIPALLKKSTRVCLARQEGKTCLVELAPKAFRKPFAKPIDVAFPVVHGTNVEDGTLQGLFQMFSLPYVGCDVTSSAVGMDKFVMKAVLRYAGIPVLDGMCPDVAVFRENPQGLMDEIEQKIGYPVIVKPVNLGSSVGIRIAKNREALEEALDYAYGFSMRVLIERAIMKLKEVNCSVVGDYEKAEASECESPMGHDEILSYQDKYMSGGAGKGGIKGGAKSGSLAGAKGGSEGMASLARKIPADISDECRTKIRDMAVKTFRVLNCSGVSRIDFMIDEEDGSVYVNEINTIPGSLSFYLWEPLGVSYPQLLQRMIKLALKREREQQNLSFSFDSNLLANANLPRPAKQ